MVEIEWVRGRVRDDVLRGLMMVSICRVFKVSGFILEDLESYLRIFSKRLMRFIFYWKLLFWLFFLRFDSRIEKVAVEVGGFEDYYKDSKSLEKMMVVFIRKIIVEEMKMVKFWMYLEGKFD